MLKKSLLLMLLMALIAPWAAAQEPIPYEEGFEDYSSGLPTGWTKVGSGTVAVQTSYVHNGSKSLKFNGALSNVVALPEFTVETNTLQITVFTRPEGSYSSSKDFDIGYITDVTDASTFVQLATYNYSEFGGAYGERGPVSMSTAPAGARIAFRHRPSSTSYYWFVDDITVEAIPNCLKPMSLTCTSADESSITLNWTESGSATEWQLCLNGDESNLIDVTTKPYTVPGLASQTTYTVKVRAVCEEYSSWSNEISCSTTAVATPVGDNWSDDFEGSSCSWDFVNGTLINNWVWGTATNNGGTHSLYVSSDGGATTDYNAANTKIFAAKLLGFTDGKFEFAYDWICTGESGWDFLRVALVPASTTLTAGSDYGTIGSSSLPTGWIALDGGGQLQGVTTWQNKSVAINVTAGNYYMVLAWRNDTGVYPPAAAVDNVSITKLACPYDVTDLEPSNITTHTATLTWTAGEATGWEVMWADNNAFENASTQIVSAATIDLPGLSASSTYYAKVRAYCGGSDYGSWCDAISFDTECEAIAALGYTENFDLSTSGSMPNSCWRRINEGTSYNTYPVVNNNSYYSSPNALRFYCYGNSSNTALADQYAVLPEMTGLDGLQITFMARGYSGDANVIKIGMMEDPTDVSTFALIDTKTLTNSYEEFNINLTGKANYVAFLMEKPSSESNVTLGVYIDNISIHTPPTCIKPTNLVAAAEGLDATVTWESDASEWQVARAISATADPSANILATVSSKTFKDSSLSLGDYYYWVRTYCSAADQSDWVGPVSTHIGYCVPSNEKRDGKGITGVVFGTGDDIVNNTDATNGLPATSPYYGDYTSMVGAVQAGVEATIAITTATSSYPYTFIIWVDFDNSLSFEDSEVVYTGKCSSGAMTLNANITVPATQAIGNYRMRISGADSYYNNFYNNGVLDWTKEHNPCNADSYTYMVTHDYTLRVLEKPSCLTPTALNVTTDGATAIATWSGEGTSYNIDINGTVTNNVTTPYEFPVALSTDYAVKVQANCSGSETSDWSNVCNFTTPPCVGGHTIEYTLTDSYNDGWESSYITIYDGCNVLTTLTVANGASPVHGTLTLCGDYYEFVLTQGSCCAGEHSWVFTEGGTTLFSGTGSNYTDGATLYTIGTPSSCAVPSDLTNGTPDKTEVELSWTENGTATSWQICVNGDEENLIDVTENPYLLGGLTPDTDYTVKVRAYCDKEDQSCWSNEVDFTTAEACAKPTNLTETNITTESATLSWEGTSGNYVLQYRPWIQVGDDQLSTDEFVIYTYDLSEYKGQGSIAIRHYDVSDKFYLNVDDVELRDSDDAVIFSEDFESGNIPSTWTNYDVDGDGYTWDIASSANMSVIGNYGIYSASWISGVGALHPDNWLIINNVPMGGTFSFKARGQDPSYPDENFAVYISLESDVTEIALTDTSYDVTELTPGTDYAWQVKSDCGVYQSNWVTSIFKTNDNLLVFVADGDWDDLGNWEDVNGDPATALPTVDNKVRIDANATIPAGVIATAGKTTMGDNGSLTIEDGGQIKHSAATLWVTMEKNITGVGENWETPKYRAGYYFISTPFSGTTQIEQTGTWSHVNNIIPTADSDYVDLYAFYAPDEASWINYKAHPTHEEFTAGSNNGLVFRRGYLYASKEDRTVTFTGTISKTINNTTSDAHNFDPSSTTPRFNGFKLVGNPYACNAYLTFTPSGLSPSEIDFYVLNADGDDFDLSETNVALPPLTGAFIWADAEGTIDFATEVPGGKRGSSVLNINLAKNGKDADKARIRFGEGIRLAKYQLKESSSIFFTEEDTDYAVVFAEQYGEKTLNFKAETAGQYTISFKLDGANLGYLHLIDKLAGEDINLLTNPSYTFIGSPRDAEDRFIVKFSETSTNDTFIYQSDNDLVVCGEGELQVFDVMGRFVGSYNVNGVQTVSKPAEGVYIFRLVGETIKTQKIVVR